MGKKAEGLSQLIYHKDVLTMEWKPAILLRQGHVYAYISTGNEEIWLPTKLKKNRSDQGNLLSAET